MIDVPDREAVPSTESELQERVDKARAAREELSRVNAERDKIARLTAEAEAEERALKEEQVLDELVAVHGALDRQLARVQTTEGMIVVKKPNHLLFKRYQDKGTTDTVALEQLVRPCLVYPSKAHFDALLEEVPAALMRCANAVCKLAGFGRDEISGK